MKYGRCSFGDTTSYVEIEGEVLHELTGPPYRAHERTGRTVAADGARFLAPCEPRTIFAMAGNYLDHLRSEHAGSVKPPEEPRPFLKVATSVIGPGDTILLPPEQELGEGAVVEEEAELVVVMGRECRRVAEPAAMEYVFGYTCGNDVSARAWQKSDLNWWRAKSSDTFTPLGPFIVTGIEGANLQITARVNGTEVQRCNTRDMIHDIPTLISFLSRSVTLHPGDLIFTGTTGVPGRIRHGDTVDVEIESIGVLSNPVLKALPDMPTI